MADEVISRLVLAWDAGAMGRLRGCSHDQPGGSVWAILPLTEEGHGGVSGVGQSHEILFPIQQVPVLTYWVSTSTCQAKIGGRGPTFIRQASEKCFNASCASSLES